MSQTTLTFDVSTGNGDLQITAAGRPRSDKIVSFQAVGDANVNGAVTAQLQESNLFAGTYKDISGAVATVDMNTNEYVDGGQFNSAFLSINILVGAATAGIITFTINYK